MSSWERVAGASAIQRTLASIWCRQLFLLCVNCYDLGTCGDVEYVLFFRLPSTGSLCGQVIVDRWGPHRNFGVVDLAGWLGGSSPSCPARPSRDGRDLGDERARKKKVTSDREKKPPKKTRCTNLSRIPDDEISTVEHTFLAIIISYRNAGKKYNLFSPTIPEP